MAEPEAEVGAAVRTAPLRVLHSFKAGGPRANPYTTQLLEALDALDGVSAWSFSWQRALRGAYDVVHLHWPEALIERRGRAGTAARQLLLLALLVRWRLRGVAVVRTVHNLELPSGLPRQQVALLRLVERWTDLEVHLNDSTRRLAGRPVAVVPHGHYREWFAPHPRSAAEPGQVAFVGRVRRYKGVELLVAAFRDLPLDPPRTLRVAGAPSSQELVDQLRADAGGDPRIRLEMSYLDDADLVREVTAAELVVLPAPEMHNSGTVLAALSLDRPVLVPDNPVNRALAAEVGEQWVRVFDAPLRAEHLAAGAPPAGAPALAGRDWDRSALLHREAYRAALGSRRARGRRT